MQLPKETTRTVVVSECTADDPSGPTASTIARKPQPGQIRCQDQRARLPPQAHTHHQSKACQAECPGPPSSEGGFCCCSMYVVRCCMFCVRCPFCSCVRSVCFRLYLTLFAFEFPDPMFVVRCSMFCIRCLLCERLYAAIVFRCLSCVVRFSLFVVLRSLFDVRPSLSILFYVVLHNTSIRFAAYRCTTIIYVVMISQDCRKFFSRKKNLITLLFNMQSCKLEMCFIFAMQQHPM